MTTLAPDRAAGETSPARRLFTVGEYYAMASAGVLADGERVELVDGEIMAMSPIGDEHSASVDLAAHLLGPPAAGRANVRIQNHLRLDERNQPEPDIALVKWRDDFYRHRAPGANDVLLLIEVSDSSLSYDRNVKLALYARFLIPEVWLANILARAVEAYSEPVDGKYATTRVYRSSETISPAALPDIALPVSELVGAESAGLGR